LVEQAMFFLMGFLVAGLIALLFLPVLAARARRLSEARARLMAPLSQQQALAERDQLRAGHAVERRRLEQRMAGLEESAATHRAELGRHAATIVRLEDVAAERLALIATQRAEIGCLSEKAGSLEADLSAAKSALADFAGQAERGNAEIAQLGKRRLELETSGDKNRAIIAGLETRSSGLEVALEDAKSNAQTALREARGEATRLSRALFAQPEESRHLDAALAEAMTKGALLVGDAESRSRALEALRARVAEAEALVARSERAREDALVESNRLLSIIADRDRALAEEEVRAGERETRLARQLKSARADGEAAALAQERLGLGASAAEGAIRASRSDRATLQRDIEMLRDRLLLAEQSSTADAALRQAISRLGNEALRLAAPAAQEATARSNLLNFELREPGSPFESNEDGAGGATVVKLRQMTPHAPDR
jgi:hypothetical protein